MALSDVSRSRVKPLAPETVARLAREYRFCGSQYSIFAEVPTVSDKTIRESLDTAYSISTIRDTALRADTAGSMQALTSLWQILCRQGSISAADADATLAGGIDEFGKMKNGRELFDS